MYIVYGWDRKTDDTVILYETDIKSSAIHWAKKYTLGPGDAGNWDQVYVVERYQDDIDWNNEPVIKEATLWSFYQECMDWSDNAMEEF